ncbi:MAG TPA: efflux RND transporter permease subunit, partial [Bacillota bacterium]|nr:efflux RND transporter permease subunit [Bacillota bacterium]
MKSLIEFCIKRPVTIVMFFSALMILGVFSGMRMPIDLMPDITFPAINVTTTYSGAGPEEIEELVTIPVEQAVSTVNGVKSISSTSSEGRSRVTIFFDWGVNLEEATNDIRANLDRIRQRLPDGAGQPSLFKFNPSSMPVVTIGLSSHLDEDTLRQLAEDDFSYQIQKVEGVANVKVRGGRNREIRVYLKQDRLLSMGISSDQVISALKNENVMQPAGNLGIGAGDFLLRTKGEFTSIDDIRNLIVLYREGVPIYLRDLADVEEGYETARSLVRIDGLPGVVLSVQKRSGSNTVAVADRIYKAVEELRRQNPDINFRILNDNSTYIRQSVQGVKDSAVMGAILAGIVLLLFLHSVRATLITAVVMPISILTTMMLAYF